MRTVTFEFKEEKHLDFFVELLITAALNYVQAKKELDAENMSLRSATREVRDITPTLEAAKSLLTKEGYIFYKKPKNFGGAAKKK